MMGNVFALIPENLAEEVVEQLAQAAGTRIERIVSRGHSSPEDFWYDQEQNEWVLLLSGRARLAYRDGGLVSLEPGDYVDIPAHTKHRVEWTDPDENTVWLAVFY